MRKFALITAVTLSLGAMAAGTAAEARPDMVTATVAAAMAVMPTAATAIVATETVDTAIAATPTVAGIAVASGPALPSALASLAWRLAPSQPAPPAIPTTTMAMAVRPMGDPLTATATEPS